MSACIIAYALPHPLSPSHFSLLAKIYLVARFESVLYEPKCFLAAGKWAQMPNNTPEGVSQHVASRHTSRHTSQRQSGNTPSYKFDKRDIFVLLDASKSFLLVVTNSCLTAWWTSAVLTPQFRFTTALSGISQCACHTVPCTPLWVGVQYLAFLHFLHIYPFHAVSFQRRLKDTYNQRYRPPAIHTRFLYVDCGSKTVNIT